MTSIVAAIADRLTRRTFCAAICLALTGCGGSMNAPGPALTAQQPQPAAGATPLTRGPSVKVALLLPLSKEGEVGAIARDIKQAGELALFEFDKPNVTLLAKDTKGTAEGAQAAAQEAVQAGAELIIGPLLADSVRAVQPIAAGANVPVIAFSSDPAVAGNGVYLLSFLAGDDVERIVSYSVREGRQAFSALIPQTPYGDVVAAEFSSAVARNGGRMIALERFPVEADGMLEPARKVSTAVKAAAGVEQAIFIPAGGEALPTLSPMLPYFDIDTKLVKPIGTRNWDYPGVGQQEALFGGWFPAPDPNGWREFTRRYAATYGAAPNRLASLGYDAVSLAVSLSNAPAGQRYVGANLTRASGFAGVDGLFRLLASGRVERGLAVLEVQKFGSRVVDPAPSAFGASGFFRSAATSVNRQTLAN